QLGPIGPALLPVQGLDPGCRGAAGKYAEHTDAGRIHLVPQGVCEGLESVLGGGEMPGARPRGEAGAGIDEDDLAARSLEQWQQSLRQRQRGAAVRAVL